MDIKIQALIAFKGKNQSQIKDVIYWRIIERCKLVEGDLDTPCWEWQGPTSGDIAPGKTAGRGYGRISVHGCTSAVHRVMWSIIHGFLPAKKQIDHLCRNRLCCNPEHLEMVTHKQNCKRRDAARSK